MMKDRPVQNQKQQTASETIDQPAAHPVGFRPAMEF
jgi:hypothetical protein